MVRDLLGQAYGAMKHDRRRATLTMLGMAWATSLVRREVRERDLAQAKERQAQALLESVMDGSGAAVYAKDLQGKIQEAERFS